MSESNHRLEENIKFLQDSPDDYNLLPKNQTDSFLNNEHFCDAKLLNSPKYGEEPPSSLFPNLTDAVDDEFSELFYIVNPINGTLEETDANLNVDAEEHFNLEENLDVVPAKRQKTELTVYEETLLKNFSSEIQKEQQLLAEEHEMKMKLWDLQMQTSQQQHALKMAILKEQLEKVQQEKKNLEIPQNLRYLSKFKSGPI